MNRDYIYQCIEGGYLGDARTSGFQGLGFRVSGLGFRVLGCQGLGFRVGALVFEFRAGDM